MTYANYKEAITVGIGIFMISLYVGITIIAMELGKYVYYCNSIHIICNATNINNTLTWTPITKNLTDCIYQNINISDDSWKKINCYYDSKNNKCPLVECADISEESYNLIILGLCITITPIIVYIIAFTPRLIYGCYQKQKMRNKYESLTTMN